MDVKMISTLRARLRALLRKSEVERELDEELRYHVEQQTEQNIRLGMNPEDARSAARKAFGGVEQAKERSRDTRGVRWLEDLWQDLRYGARMLFKHKGFTLVTGLTLGLGIGANTAVLSVVNAVLLRPLPYHKADELVALEYRNARGERRDLFDPATFLHVKRTNTVFTDLSAFVNGASTWPVNLTGEGDPERLQGFRVSANFFRMLGVGAAQGRAFLEEEDRLGQNRVVVISHDLWSRRFNSDPGLIGRSIRLNGEPWNVVGVMPADFRLILKTDIWTPLGLTPDEESGNLRLILFGRLKPGVSIDQARQEVESLVRHYGNNSDGELRANLTSMQTTLMVWYGPELFIQLTAAGFILLITCANIANLLLARASVRQREIAIRSALGAGRLRVARQLLVESAILAVLGGACGLILAGWLIPFLVGGLDESAVAKNHNVATLRLDEYALGFTFGLSILATILFGLVPALQASKVNLNEALKESGRGAAQGRGSNRLRSGMVVAEIALSLMLLIGAGLMSKSLWRLSHSDPGFESTGALTAKLDPTGDRYREPQQLIVFYERLLERVAAIPGVESAGLKNNWDQSYRLEIEGRPKVPEEQRPWVGINQVSADFFRAMGIHLRGGRFFSDRDVRGAQPVVIIDETLQRRYFPDENPLGKHLRFYDGSREIVGVVGGTRAWHRFSLGKAEVYPRLYLPYQQADWRSMYLVARARAGDPASLIPAIRRELAAIDKDLPIHDFKSLEQSAHELNADVRFSTLLIAAFAVLAALLAGVGIYGVMSYAVAERTQEIGVRMALGAQTGAVLKLIVRQGLKLAFAGIVLGLAGSFALTRALANLLYGVSASDPATFVIAPLLLVCVALLACYLPARHATKVDPLVALRRA
jgi:putative ABC transport system permease protein